MLIMDFEAISTAPWQATKYSFTSLVNANRTEVSSFFRTRTNASPPLRMTIYTDFLPTIITWKKGWSGLNLPRFDSVRVYSTLFFDRVIDKLMI